jgi:hypothetical protein
MKYNALNLFRKLLIILICLIAIDFEVLLAQSESDNNPKHFFRLIVGVGSTNNIFKEKKYGLTGGIVASFQRNRNLFTLRYLGMVEPIFFHDIGPSENMTEYSMLYGMDLLDGEYGYCAISSGISVIKGIKRGKWLGVPGEESYEYEKLTFRNIGFPIDIHLFFTAPILGFGIYLFSNINSKQNFYGWLMCLQFGKLK